MEPGVKIAAISKSGQGVTPSEAASETAQPKKESAEKQASKAETAPIKETTKEPSLPQAKAKAPSTPPSKPAASEPQLPPKDRERRVSFKDSNKKVISSSDSKGLQ